MADFFTKVSIAKTFLYTGLGIGANIFCYYLNEENNNYSLWKNIVVGGAIYSTNTFISIKQDYSTAKSISVSCS